MSVKIAVNGRALSTSEPGGDVQASISLLNHLNKLPNTEIIVYGHRSVEKRLPQLKVQSDQFNMNSQIYGLIWEQFVPVRKAEATGADLLFCPNGNGPVYSTDIPVITNVQSIFAYQGMAPTSYELLQKFRAPRVIHHSDKILCVSNYLRRQIINNMNVSKDGINVIYNGIDEIYKTDTPGEPIQLPDNYILFVGGMNKRKNIQTLINSFIHLHKQYDHSYELVLVGPTAKRIYQNINISESIRNHIHKMGFINDRKLKYVYRNASVFVFPSLFETFGLPPLEAMACDTPVIASSRPALPEILGNAAHYVDPLEKTEIVKGIISITENKQYKNKLVERGSQKAKKYTWTKAAKSANESIHELINKVA
jgi:glycosyltransferase involved in cell wall biosynthesis